MVRRLEIGHAFPLRFQQVEPGFLGANRNRLAEGPYSRMGDLPAIASGIHFVLLALSARLWKPVGY